MGQEGRWVRMLSARDSIVAFLKIKQTRNLSYILIAARAGKIATSLHLSFALLVHNIFITT